MRCSKCGTENLGKSFLGAESGLRFANPYRQLPLRRLPSSGLSHLPCRMPAPAKILKQLHLRGNEEAWRRIDAAVEDDPEGRRRLVFSQGDQWPLVRCPQCRRTSAV